MQAPRRRKLADLSEDLDDETRTFLIALRAIYEDRMTLTVGGLAAALHVSTATASRYLSGKTRIPAEHLERLCCIARLSPAQQAALRSLHTQAYAPAADSDEQTPPSQEALQEDEQLSAKPPGDHEPTESAQIGSSGISEPEAAGDRDPASPPPVPPAQSRRSKGRRWRAAAGVALVLLGTGIGIGWLVRSSPDIRAAPGPADKRPSPSSSTPDPSTPPGHSPGSSPSRTAAGSPASPSTVPPPGHHPSETTEDDGDAALTPTPGSPFAAPPADSPAPRSSATSTCRQLRQYEVTEDGDVLDADGKDIGDVIKGQRFNVEPDQSDNPYQHRYYGTIDGSDLAGYVDQAKLDPAGSVCG